MAFYLNRAQVIGNLAADAEYRELQNGGKMLTFSIATAFEWKDQSGNPMKKTEFHPCVIFGDFAETMSRFLHKGKKVYADGRMETVKWQTKEGENRSKVQIRIQNIISLDRLVQNDPDQAKHAPDDTPPPEPTMDDLENVF
jgi:single-strand DNA-binding protein